MHYVGDLPGEVDRIADARIHALPTDWTVDVRRVSEQERTPFAELIGDPMVHAVRREPIDALNVDVHPLDDTLTHIVPREILVLMLGTRAHGADETRAPVAL